MHPSTKYSVGGILRITELDLIDRSKGLDLADRVPEVPWMEVTNTVQGAAIKTILKKKVKQLSEET